MQHKNESLCSPNFDYPSEVKGQKKKITEIVSFLCPNYAYLLSTKYITGEKYLNLDDPHDFYSDPR